MPSIREDRYETEGTIQYIKFREDYDKFGKWKENTKSISKHKEILKYLTKEW